MKREEALVLAQTEADIQKIRNGELLVTNSPDGRKLLKAPEEEIVRFLEAADDSASLQSAETSVQAHEAARLLKQEVNVAKAILHAEQELRSESEPPPVSSIDGDWLERWRTYAGGVSSDDLQSLWGRVLAGEVKQPGFYSLRLLDFVKNLSTEEANKIGLIAPYVVSRFIFREQMGEQLFHYDFLSEIQELGLISGVGGAPLQVTLRNAYPEADLFFMNPKCGVDLILHVKADDPNRTLLLPVYPVTKLGLQIFPLARANGNQQYLERVARTAMAQGFHASIHRQTSSHAGVTTYDIVGNFDPSMPSA